MRTWLILEVALHFSEKPNPISNNYRGDLQPDGSNTYYGVHFISAPSTINPGDRLTLQVVLRAFPKDPCAAFQIGKEVLLKEGPFTRAEGVVKARREHESSTQTVLALVDELEGEHSQ